MLVSDPSLKKISHEVFKPCPMLKLLKCLSFKGTYENTVKALPIGTVYPIGNNLVIQKDDKVTLLREHDNQITTFALSPSGNFIVTGQLGSNNAKNYESPVCVWDAKTLKLIKILSGLKDGIRNVMVSPDEQLIAAVSFKNQLMLWHTKSMTLAYTKIFQFKVSILGYLQGLVLSVDKGICQMTFETPNNPTITSFTLPATGLPRNYTCVDRWKDRIYIVGTEGGQLCVFDKGIFKLAFAVGKGKVSSVLVHSNMVYIVVAEQVVKLAFEQSFIEKARIKVEHGLTLSKGLSGEIWVQSKGRLSILNAESMQLQNRIQAHYSAVVGLAARGDVIYSIESNGAILEREMKNWQAWPIYVPPKPLQGCCLCLATDQDEILSGWEDGTVKGHRPHNKKLSSHEWEIHAHKGRTSCVLANDHFIASGGQDAMVRLWARKTHQLLQQITVHQKTIGRVLVDVKQPHLVHSCSYDKSLHTYDLKVDKKVCFHQAKNGSLLDMDQRKDTGEIITCGSNTPISYWQQKTVAPVAELDFPLKLLCVAISPNVRYVIFGCQDGNIYLFETATKKYLGGGMLHSHPVNCLKWINDTVIVSASADGSTAVWKLEG